METLDNDVTWLALAIWDEARGEIMDGKAAVGRVITNRTKKHYASDGTIKGTILHPNAFSGFWFDMVNGKYTKVCHTLADAEAKAATLLTQAVVRPDIWAECKNVAAMLLHGDYQGGPSYAKMTDEVVLYLNPAVVHPLPDWASPSKLVCIVGHQDFYHN